METKELILRINDLFKRLESVSPSDFYEEAYGLKMDITELEYISGNKIKILLEE